MQKYISVSSKGTRLSRVYPHNVNVQLCTHTCRNMARAYAGKLTHASRNDNSNRSVSYTYA